MVFVQLLRASFAIVCSIIAAYAVELSEDVQRQGVRSAGTVHQDEVTSSGAIRAATSAFFRRDPDPEVDPEEESKPLKSLEPESGPRDVNSSNDKPNLNAELHFPDMSNCHPITSSDEGSSDSGNFYQPCVDCEQGCTAKNRQPPQKAAFYFEPSLSDHPAHDLFVGIELRRIEAIAPFSENGIYQKFKFIVDNVYAPSYLGEMGPEVRGGVQPGEVLNGEHIFSVSDTMLPAPDLAYNNKRWLAIPGRSEDGDIGVCQRECIRCADSQVYLELKVATGVVCRVTFGAFNDGFFIYRLHKSAESRSIVYGGDTYRGSEWEVLVRDGRLGQTFALGRIVLEGNDGGYGVSELSVVSEHIGCAPCDAYYQSSRVWGPFIVNPKDVHHLREARLFERNITEIKSGRASRCDKQRAYGSGGRGIIFESGPGVTHSGEQHNQTDHDIGHTLFSCTKAGEESPFATDEGEEDPDSKLDEGTDEDPPTKEQEADAAWLKSRVYRHEVVRAARHDRKRVA